MKIAKNQFDNHLLVEVVFSYGEEKSDDEFFVFFLLKGAPAVFGVKCFFVHYWGFLENSALFIKNSLKNQKICLLGQKIWTDV